jgi:lysophospholipase L1-like esterase
VKTRYLVGGGVLALAVAAIAVTAAYSAQGIPSFPPAAAASAPPAETSDQVGFAVIGDSITAWVGKEEGSWTSHVGTDGVLFSENGWARNGAPLALMDDNTPRLNEDVLVILAGTNDLRSDVPFDERLDIIDSIVRKAGVENVVVSAIPPFDPKPSLATAWNEQLESYAADAGHVFVDPWVDLRTRAGSYLGDATIDGVHPTPDAAEQAAAPMRVAIIAAGR